MDLYSRTDITIEPGEIGYIPLNATVEIPEGYWGLLAARSSTHKMGIVMANGVGVIDADFCGDGDELVLAALNYTKQKVTIERGTRIAQMMILPLPKITLTEVDILTKDTRGGFGTTGNQ